jgi:hypothetical protein
VAAEASVLAHRLKGYVLDSFRLEWLYAQDEERSIHREGEAVLDDGRSKDLQQRAEVEDGTEKDMASLYLVPLRFQVAQKDGLCLVSLISEAVQNAAI